MSKRKVFHKITALLLSAIMVVGMTPVSASADTDMLSYGVSSEIIAFEALKSEIAEQSVPLGTSEADLGLPDTLTATVRFERGMFGAATEQFTLTPGGTYYFDLSGETIPGTKNTALPDSSLKWVPFTYAGTVNAYSLDASSSSNTTASANATPSDRSLFVADYNITHTVSWAKLHTNNLIFGKNYTSGGVAYTLRSLSEGSNHTGSGNAERGTPETNEWDQILNKDSDYINNWSTIYSWGQDTYSGLMSDRALRGFTSSRFWNCSLASYFYSYYGFRPALEILNPDTLGSDGLKTVTYDMGSNGTLGAGSHTSAAVVYTGTLTLPEITEANGFTYTGTGAGDLGWYDAAGKFYRAGTQLADLTTGTVLTASYVKEQFTLTPGGIYYFDLSGETIPGTKNTDLPDSSLKWVPFTYVGTINAYSLDESLSGDVNASANATPSDRSLFVADYNITDTVSWDNLHTNNLIFGKNYTSGGVAYTLRSLSAGSNYTGSGDARRGTPETNEWDQILNKDSDYMNNWSGITSWGQDTNSDDASYRAIRGYHLARYWSRSSASLVNPYYGIRPALEILNPDTLGSDGLKTVTLKLNRGKLKDSTDDIHIVYTGNSFTAPDSEGLTAPIGKLFSGWKDDHSTATYVSGAAVPHTVTSLIAQWVLPAEASPTAIFTATGADTGTLSGVTDGMKYRIDNGLWIDITDSTGISLTNLSTCTIEVVKKGNGTTTVDSPAQEITVTKADTPALTATQPSVIGGNGSIPMTTNHEYRSETDSTWTSASGNTTLAPGTYLVRITANGTALASESQSITLTAFTGGSGGDGGSYAPDIPATIIPEQKPDQPMTATAPVTATRGANGTASATIPEKAITDAIAKAQADARAQGKTANGISVGLNVTMPKGATSLTAALTQNSLNSLVNAGVSWLELDGAPISLGLDLNALKEIQKQSSGDISITIAPATGLSKEAKALLGNRPVYSITISYVDKNGKTKTITSLDSGIATLSIPHTPGKNEAVGYLFGVYVDANGKAQRIDGSAYDANSGSLLIPTGHFSVYGVGYTAPSAKFTDIVTHWGKEAIDYVVGRGLLYGTSKTTFAPDTAMTRGMLVTALGRLAGVDVKAYTTNSFTDVKADSAFRPYIEWAYKNGVVQGIGNQQFAPDRAITREEIAVIFANYAKATGYKLPVTREATNYADASGIGSVYQTAVTAMQQAGIMMGGTGNKFNPKASATRAEVSSMLHRYIKLTIDPATAQGWAKNDAGQYLYYKDGKALTGTQTIDGAKYFFETNGTLKTGWVKDGDNWRYYSGNKAAMGWLDISDKRYYFTKNGLMVSGKWLKIDGKWYYFYANGALAKNAKIDGYEVDKNGVRKSK